MIYQRLEDLAVLLRGDDQLFLRWPKRAFGKSFRPEARAVSGID
jgi:hypothetical protein